MAPFVNRVIAVDESPAMLRASRARLASRANVEVRDGTLEALPIEGGQLDVAILSLVLHYVTDPGLAFAGIQRTLKKGARLLIVDMMPHDREEYRQTMGHVWLGFGEDQLARWSEEAGFASCLVSPLTAPAHSKGPTLFSAVLHKQ
jgi:ubiquinone/menaquinone biosynthesis C-methylase UbiE